jgi:hypothetical protein
MYVLHRFLFFVYAQHSQLTPKELLGLAPAKPIDLEHPPKLLKKHDTRLKFGTCEYGDMG